MADTDNDWLKEKIENAGHFYYFAYSSNMCGERLIQQLSSTAVFKSIALLENYRLHFNGRSNNWKGATATIVKKAGRRVCGVVYRLKRAELANLDLQEALGIVYDRIEVRVSRIDHSNSRTHPTRSIRCVTYLKRNRLLPAGKPSPHFKQVIISGAREKQLPEEYLNELEYIEDNGYQGTVTYKLQCLDSLNRKRAQTHLQQRAP